MENKTDTIYLHLVRLRRKEKRLARRPDADSIVCQHSRMRNPAHASALRLIRSPEELSPALLVYHTFLRFDRRIRYVFLSGLIILEQSSLHLPRICQLKVTYASNWRSSCLALCEALPR